METGNLTDSRKEDCMDNSKSLFPILETERLLLRKLSDSDADILFPYWSCPEVTEYFTMEPFKQRQEAVEMIQLLNSLYDKDDAIRWGLVIKNTGMLCGTCGFHNLRPEHKRAEIGYEIGKQYWGQGIMAEALRKILEYGFSNMSFNRIEAFINKGNQKSMNLVEKLGFLQDGLLREYEFARGSYVDQYCYSLLKKDWEIAV